MRISPDNHASKQLQDFSGELQEQEWLHSVGLLSSAEEPYSILENSPWVQGGGESYILDLTVESHTANHHLMAKACIKMCASEAMKEWIGRREVLGKAGVLSPVLYAEHRATLLEEYIPYELSRVWRDADTTTRKNLSDQVVDTYAVMIREGFHPISLHDLRSRGDDIVVIDFGSDLGGNRSDRSGRVPESKTLKADVNRLVGFTIAS